MLMHEKRNGNSQQLVQAVSMFEVPLNGGCMQEWLLGVLEAVVQLHKVDHLHRCGSTSFIMWNAHIGSQQVPSFGMLLMTWYYANNVV